MNKIKRFIRKISVFLILAMVCGLVTPVGVKADGVKYYFDGGMAEGAIVITDKKEKGKYGFMDKNGRIIIEPKYDMAYGFREGLAAVIKGGKLGFINKKGKEVIPTKYHSRIFHGRNNFEEGLAVVVKGDKYDFINKEGKRVIRGRYDDAYSFSEGLALVEKGGKWGFINTKGEVVIPLKYEKAYK